MPSKEAKHLTYRLLADNYIQMQVVKKAGGGGMGPAKNFFMFYVDQGQLALMSLETCYKALFNSITKAKFIMHQNKRLIDKAQKLETTAEVMKDRGDTEDFIAEVSWLTPGSLSFCHRRWYDDLLNGHVLMGLVLAVSFIHSCAKTEEWRPTRGM